MKAGELYFAKAGDRLVAADEDAALALHGIGQGEIVGLRFSRARNPAFNRKYRALVRHVYQAAHGQWRSVEDLHVELKVRCGLYTEHLTARGELIYVPDSTAFDRMDETTFSKFYDDVIRLICAEVVPGLDEADLRAFLEESRV